jgi:SSS family solute:Na+ symporter
MAVAVNLTPTYPLQVAGYVFPGYTAFYTVILNIVLVVVLTPLFNALSTRGTSADATVGSDYRSREAA